MSKKRIIAIVIDLLLIALTLFFIFGNSAKNTEKSGADSEAVTSFIEQIPPIKEAIENNTILDCGEIILEKNEEAQFIYEPIQNEVYKIYTNAVYISEDTDIVIATSNDGVEIYDGLQCSFAEMESKGVTVLDDTGKTISYNGSTFTLVERLE